MGTRSQTHVKDEHGRTLVTIYRQYDGYPSGMGVDLASFADSGPLVNGISPGQRNVFSGMGCFAASLIKELKEGPGGIYIHRPNSKDYWEEYTYEIRPFNNIIHIRYSLRYSKKVPGKVLQWTEWYTAHEATQAFRRSEEE